MTQAAVPVFEEIGTSNSRQGSNTEEVDHENHHNITTGSSSVSTWRCEQAGKRATERRAPLESPADKDASKLSASQPATDKGRPASSHAIVAKLGGQETQVSLEGAAAVQAATLASDRKIIRNAELTIETDSPTDNLRKITSIAEAQGGFVVTSEFKQNDGGPQTKPTQTVTVVARVPSSGHWISGTRGGSAGRLSHT